MLWLTLFPEFHRSDSHIMFYHKTGVISINNVTNIFSTFVKETFFVKDIFSLREGCYVPPL